MRSTISANGLDEALASLSSLGEGLAARALADALNHTANQARLALRAEMADVFDRPTPFTLNAIRILNAKPNTLEAAVWVKDEKDNASKGFAPEDWVAPQVFGGPRAEKKSESLLRAKRILPAGKFIAPAAGARLDAYGNISRGQMQQILSGLIALEGSAGYTANASNSWRSIKKGHEQAYFVMRRGKTPIGIAERRGKTVQMVLAFVSQPQYRRRLDFHGVVERTADANLETNVDKAITNALSGNLPNNFKRRPQSQPSR
ncbi:hypothetical protein [Pseudomonas sp. S9]|uniref:hypothetical protein n=1 Tax=Pseudomonas sp. S9 TaxID=686578 RepID=UPI0002556FED|nr:hypothetical protein [Pseudomonas sp. S9]